MYCDITTPEKQLKEKLDYQKHLRKELIAAIRSFGLLGGNDRALALKRVNNINRIRYRIYEKAVELGYVKKCKDSIPVCKGECCKWHFPKDLSRLDFFVTVCSISSEKQNTLVDQLLFNTGQYQCPLLREDGCLLSFGRRPLVCSSAYPCFAGDAYHAFLEKQRKETVSQFLILKEALQGKSR